jgi:ParB-like chromosome segregation protein Spo0J
VAYAVGKSDPHTFQALEDSVLISVFRPALVGDELHDENRSYGAFVSPVYGVVPVPIDKVQANDYNPNTVAPPEMELLETSIWEDGYTQPVVTFYDEKNDKYIVVDGFHRFLILKNSERIRERERGMLPVVVIDKEMGDRMASTIRHNRARGTHNIELMSTIVLELVEMGKGDRWICKHIGMSQDELLRLKQITGLASLFQNRDFSASWEAEIEGGDELGDDWIDLDGEE